MTVKLCTALKFGKPWIALLLIVASSVAFGDIVVVSKDGPDVLSINDLKEIMIKESVDAHGYCACPYSRSALGGQCGTLSKYYEPGNEENYCYREDISNNDVYFFRLKRVKLDPQEVEDSSDVEVEVPLVPDYTQGYFENNAPKNSIQDAENNATNATPSSSNRSPVSNYFNTGNSQP